MTAELSLEDLGLTSRELVQQFDDAAGLAGAGDLEGSLAAWDRLLGPGRGKQRPRGKRVMTGEFLGLATMRRAWVLMDLGRLAEAREALEGPVMKACLGQLQTADLHEYHFSLGNTLGGLGRVKQMDRHLTLALNLAADELGDLQRCCQTWSNLLSHALRAKAFKFVERESRRAIAFAHNTGARAMGLEACFRHAQALRGLGKRGKAREEAEVLLGQAREAGADAAVATLESFIAEL